MPDQFEQLKQKYQPVLAKIRKKARNCKTSTSMATSFI